MLNPQMLYFTVHDELELETAEVFIRHGKRKTQEPKWYGSFCTISSYGVYGHHWSTCGEPFPQFLRKINTSYLLSKISERQPSSTKLLDSARDTILLGRDDGYFEHTEVEIALKEIDKIEAESESSADIAVFLLYDSNKMPSGFEPIDLPVYLEYPDQANLFVERLWPQIIKEMKKYET